MSGYGAALRRSVEGLGGWRDLAFFESEAFEAICAALDADDRLILPPAEDAFAVLRHTLPESVRAVILGQDPYPTPGHANGLAFSCAADVRPLPRSLGNIFKEMEADLGAAPADGDLSGWARNGVLLLNTALTVPAGEAGGHAALGWGALIDQVIAKVAAQDGIVWLLWGRHAQARRGAIEAGNGARRLIIESAHPSPLSARRGFFGSKPFSRAEAHVGLRLFTT